MGPRALRRLLLVAGAGSALMLAAACGEADADESVASAGGDSEETEEAAEDLSQEEAMLEFSTCMRDNGVESFPDLDGGAVQMTGEITDDPDFESAMEACQHWVEEFRNGGGGGPGGRGGPDVDDETLREFADCMRENGVEDFPDPSSEGMAITRDMADDPEWDEAREACSDIMEMGFGGGGN